MSGRTSGGRFQAEYTPTIISTVAPDPNLGVAGAAEGWYSLEGGWCEGFFAFRFDPAGGTSKGGAGGIYHIGLPVPMSLQLVNAGFTSDIIGGGLLWRGQNALDLGAGAHQHVWLQSAGADPTRCLGLIMPGALDNEVQVATKTASQTGITNVFTDIGLSITHTPRRSGQRLKLYAEVLVTQETLAGGAIFVQITDGAGVALKRSATNAPIGSVAFGTGLVTVPVTFVDENPAVGVAKTYKVQVASQTGHTCAVFGNAQAYDELVLEELPGNSTGTFAEKVDYLGADVPWDWDDGTGGAEIWGQFGYRVAA